MTENKIVDLEQRIMKWAEDNPEPVYMTWMQLLVEYGVLKPYGESDYQIVNKLQKKRVSKNIAEMLELEPEGL